MSASILALDLVRHPHGALVADTTDRVLALQPDDLEQLAHAAGRHDLAAARVEVLDAGRDAPRAPDVLRAAGSVVRGPDLYAGEADTVVEALSQTLLGDLDGLLGLLRAELPLSAPAAPPAGVQAALDAVAGAWVGGRYGPRVLAAAEQLRRPWDEALPMWPPPLPEDGYGGHLPDLRDLLDAVCRLEPAAWDRVAAAHAQGRGTLRWSDALHIASVQAHQGGRVTTVARAQLAAARALRLSPASTTATVRGTAMAVVAAVQAVCVLDLIDVGTARTLLSPWQAGAGAL